ncbi:CAP domain-containing protein [Cyathus striatus]|nr:CAP domain-containing protein [Cyathus striatus]
MHFYKSLFGLVAIAFSSAAALVTPDIKARDAWSDQVVQLHNSYRAQYGANPVSWNQDLYASTLQWAQGCNFAHSGGSGYGENLAAGSGGYSFSDAMNTWMSEVSQYDYNNPGFSSDTGHFTQIVWKATTGVACAVATCPAGTIFSSLESNYYVCRYTPPGNVIGQFAQNVGRHV